MTPSELKELDRWNYDAKDVAEYFKLTPHHVRQNSKRFLGIKVGGAVRYNIARILRKAERETK